ncbi:cell division protein FtsZ [beta proteobacterium AAP121]|nr:cell division protein FtsZ [beta proteobacterium AAP65]KPF94999.1 cell division protein FtsZ [beta proteobacterium AAP121]
MELGLGAALSLAGAAVLAALGLHGWWTTRRAAQRGQPRAAPTSVLPDDRVEPLLGAEPAAAGDADTGPDTEPAPLRTPTRRVPRLDALIDAIVPMALEAPVSGDMALQHLPPSRRAGSKPFYIEGLDTETGTWEPLQAGRRYGELQAGVQLASRTGALGEIEYSEFIQKLQAFADAMGARMDPPDMLEVVARARELDGLTSPLDAQLTVTLRTNSVAWSVAFVQQVAQRAGLVPGVVPGRLVLPADEEGAPPVLVLAVDAQAALAALDQNPHDSPQATAVRECSLVLDVPQTPASAEPFPAWHRLGKQLSDELDATVVDDQGQPLTLHDFAGIGREVNGLYAQLEALDLAAGSAAARRLFS